MWLENWLLNGANRRSCAYGSTMISIGGLLTNIIRFISSVFIRFHYDQPAKVQITTQIEYSISAYLHYRMINASS